jgi:hypothetical protein
MCNLLLSKMLCKGLMAFVSMFLTFFSSHLLIICSWIMWFVGDGISMLKSLTFKVHILDHNLKQYQRSNITIFQPSLSILLAYGGNDVVVDHNDFANLINLLQGVIKVRYVPNYAHGDFVFGTTNGIILYNHILSFFKT